MVRYPDKKPLQPIIKPQAQPVSPDVDKEKKEQPVAEAVKPKAAHEIKDGQVEELQQRLHTLEEKLNSLQTANLSQPVSAEDKAVRSFAALLKWWQRFRFIFIAAAIGCVLVWAVLIIMGHVYVAGFSLELRPDQFNGQDNRMVLTNHDLVQLEEQPDLWHEFLELGLTRLNARSDGSFIEGQFISFGALRTKALALAWEKDFEARYAVYRKAFLMDRLNREGQRTKDIQAQIEDVLRQMSDFKPSEQYFLVNERSKQKLAQLSLNDALSLEREYMSINDHLGGGIREKLLQHWSTKDKSLLELYRLKLTEMEFKKFLVSPEFLSTYEQGTRTFKKDAAKIINDQAERENIDEIAASLIIKDFFLSCRLAALEAVLNKRYVVSVHELSGRLADYARLKAQYALLELKMQDTTAAIKAIKNVLGQGISGEVMVRSPIHVDHI